MTISRILLCTAMFAAAGAAHAQVDLGISGPISTMDTPPSSATFTYSTQASAYNTGFDANKNPNPRYFDNLYIKSLSDGAVSWGDYPGAQQAGHYVFKSTATIPVISSPSVHLARGEIADRWDYARIGGTRSYAISVFIPKDWQFNNADMVIGQLHTSQPKEIVLSPPMAILIHDKYLKVSLQTSELTNKADVTPHLEKDTSSTQMIRLARIDETAARDKWYCFVVRAEWSNTPGAGAFKLWMNGVLKYEASNAMNAYQTDGGNYVKTGLYVPGLNGLPTYQTYTVYNDYIYTAGAAAGDPDALYKKTPCGRTS